VFSIEHPAKTPLLLHDHDPITQNEIIEFEGALVMDATLKSSRWPVVEPAVASIAPEIPHVDPPAPLPKPSCPPAGRGHRRRRKGDRRERQAGPQGRSSEIHFGSSSVVGLSVPRRELSH
jgi:hypothetical protein